MLTRKDFKMIAEIIFNSNKSAEDKLQSAQSYADALAKTNPRFNRDKFIRACINGK